MIHTPVSHVTWPDLDAKGPGGKGQIFEQLGTTAIFLCNIVDTGG
jgi:hypothetical protein